ncbi:RNA polymerase sigma factor [Parabacteroides sp. FAFU027]|uniref:RNA polymerase sigma factor n=1 Tax=Parabacteroides sp. FAFU027 TaxID=2922715 RepID=UPI001FB03051|nr:RNA polymerase sigma-70 factor [Parabacteroides sp. FAFU027]
MKEDINNDRILLERLKNGDISCFEILYSKYSGKLYNYVLNISKGDFYLAEEIVQNVFVRIWEIHRHIETEGSFGSFVYTVGKNMFLNVIKNRMQEYLYHDYIIEHASELDNTVEKEVEYKMLEEQINKLIEQLPPARRKVYILSRVKHLPNKEIAALLDISENTVESQLTKATRFMRENLSPYCEIIALGLFQFYVS